MTNITIDDKGEVKLDVQELLKRRLLVQGSSGAGKSYFLRLLAELIAPKIQTIILDWEGEFLSLREKLDILIVGSGGDVSANVKTANALARSLLELKTSAVIDLYDLKIPDRRSYVRLFLEEVMRVPKSLWQPTVFIIDEAHQLCPEAGKNIESKQAVIDLVSQGRKRNFCTIVATQRISKLDKDAVAECANLVIGGTTSDIDQKRIADTLGFGSRREIAQVLREMKNGKFFGVGPAFNQRGVFDFQSAQTKTSHGTAQAIQLAVQKPSNEIRKALSALEEINVKAQQEIKDFEQAKARIQKLETELQAKPRPVAPLSPEDAGLLKTVRTFRPGMDDALPEPIRGYIDELKKRADLAGLTNSITVVGMAIEKASEITGNLQGELLDIRKRIEPLTNGAKPLIHRTVVAPSKLLGPTIQVMKPNPEYKKQVAPIEGKEFIGDMQKLGRGERIILTALAQHDGPLSRRKLAALAGCAPDSSTMRGYLAKLRGPVVCIEGKDPLAITDAGLIALGDFERLPSGKELMDYWIARVSKKAGEILAAAIDVYPAPLERDDIAARIDTDPASSTMRGYLAELRTFDLIDGGKEIKASEVFFE